MNPGNGNGRTTITTSYSLQQFLQWVVILLYDAPPQKKNEAVSKALDELSRVMEVERCSFALINPEDRNLTWAAEGTNQGIKPNNAPHVSLHPDTYDFLCNSLSDKEYLLIQDAESELPGNAGVVKEAALKYGYNSVLVVPIKKEGSLIGWLGFGNKNRPVSIEAENLEIIKAIGSYLYTAITRFKSFKALKTTAGMLEEAERIANMGSWEFDLRNKKLRTSPQLEKLLGNNTLKSTRTLFSLFRLLGPENWKKVKTHFIALFNNGNELESSCETTLNGILKNFKIKSQIHWSKKGKPYKLSGIVQDLTTQKNKDEELETARLKQDLIFRNIRDYLTLYKVVGRGQYIVDSFNDTVLELQRLFVKNINKEDILGRDLRDYLQNTVGLPEDHVSEKLSKLDGVVQSQKGYTQEEEVQRPDGSWLRLQSTLTPIIEGKEVTYLLWSAHDFTELYEAQNKLLEKDQEYRLALKASNLGFYKWNVAEEFLYLDETYSQVLGLGAKPNFVSSSFMENRLDKSSHAQLRSLLEKIIAAPDDTSVFESDITYKTPEGIKYVSSSNLFIRNKDYPSGLLLGFARDITDQKLAEQRLKESEARWRALHETASDAIIIVENDVFVDCNRAALDVYGCRDKSDFIGKTPWIFSPDHQPDGQPSREKGMAYIQQAIQGQKPKFTWTHQRANGSAFEAEVSLSAIQVQGRLLVQGIVRDVTEKMQMIKTIRESEEKYRSLIESSLQGILFLVDDKVRYFNSTIQKIFGYSSKEVYNMRPENFLELIHPQDLEDLGDLIERDYSKPLSLELRVRKKDGNYRWIKCKIGKIAYSELSSIVITLIDITEQKKAHEMALLSAIESEDRERQRIAAELHDGLGQLLSSAALNLGAMKEAMASLDQKTISNYQTALNIIQNAIAETRMISHNLMPKAIKDFGYAMAVEQLINSMREVSGVQLSFFTNFREGRLSPVLERNLYRITQEAITNIVKHSKAHSGVVQLMKYPETVILTIEDDGVGFDPQSIDTKKHIGIRNIINRTKTIGARLDIDSTLGHGTIITFQIPLIHEQ